VRDAKFLTAAAAMQPLKNANNLTLHSPGKGYIIYVESESVTLDLTKESGKYKALWIDAKSGSYLTGKKAETVVAGKTVTLKNPQSGAAVLWLEEN
jgi:hypothetical protein